MHTTIILLASCIALGACPHSRRPEQKANSPIGMDRSADSLADMRVCSSDGWCWENPMPQGNDLLAVWARDPSRLLAVGRSGTVLSFNGHAWQREVVGDAGDLRGVHGALVGKRELVALVGDGGKVYARWVGPPKRDVKGEAKSRASTPVPWSKLPAPTNAALFAVNVSPSGRIIAVGAEGLALGCTLEIGCKELPDTGEKDLHALAATKDALWVVGAEGTVLRLAQGARRFVSLAPSTSNALHSAVAFRGALWAGGEGGVLLRCVATGCEVRKALDAKGKVIALLPRGDELLALIDDGVSSRLQRIGAGKSKATRISRRLFALAPTDQAGLVAVGEGGSALLLSKKGWGHAMPLGSMAELHAIWGRSLEDAYAAGQGGTVMHFDGRSWQPLTTNTGQGLHALCLDGETNALAGGDRGLLLSCGASGCEKRTLPLTIDIRALASTGESVLAAGCAGLLLERRRGRWRRLELGATAKDKDLLALWSGKSGSYVAGAAGLLMRRKKGGWIAMASGVQGDITSLWGDGKLLYAASGDALLRCSAGGCSKLAKLAEGPIVGLWGIGEAEATMLFVSSRTGALHRFARGRWSRERVGFDGRLRALWGHDGHVWAVGEKGAVLHRLPRPAAAPRPN